MTDQATHNPAEALSRIPGPLQRVTEVVDSYATDKSRSSLLGVDRQQLIDVGLVLVEPDRPIGDGLKLLDQELGEGAVSRSAYYRFAADFRDRYAALTAAYKRKARELAELAIDEATGGQQDGLATVIKTQLLRLSAEGLITADDLREFSGKHLSAVISLLDGHTQAKFRAEELRLKAEDAERKAAKLEADLAKLEQHVEKLRLDNQRRQDELERQRKREADAVRAAEAEAQDGASGEEVVAKVREVLGLGR